MCEIYLFYQSKFNIVNLPNNSLEDYIMYHGYLCNIVYHGYLCNFVLFVVASFCYPNPCENGGICSEDDVTFKCSCAKGFTGSTCEGMSFLFCRCVFEIGTHWDKIRGSKYCFIYFLNQHEIKLVNLVKLSLVKKAIFSPVSKIKMTQRKQV